MVLLKDSKIHTLDKDKQIALLMQENERLKSRQKYGLVWEDHAEDLDNKNVIPLLDLREDLSLPKINGMPDNYLIEGDNYHALKALQHTHKGLVDVIYIDPPYNTGNQDFVYNDKMVDSDDGFRHSKWLSFMDKRLRLARNLMTDDGVIFVSIDDNEQAQLKLLMDNIFGEQNFISNLVWRKGGGKSDSRYLANRKEYVLVYKKGDILSFTSKPSDDSNYKQEDNKGKYQQRGFGMKGLKYAESLDYPIIDPDGGSIYPGGSEGEFNHRKNGNYLIRDWCWTLSEKEYIRRKNADEIEFVKRKDGWKVYYKSYLKGKSSPYEDIYTEVTNSTSSRELSNIFTEGSVFNYAKPTALIIHLLKLHPNKNATVLDFFAGSGTSAHSVMELNKEDGGNRSFIMCTNNEVSEENERNYLHSKNLISKNNKTEYNKYRKNNPEDYDYFLNSKEYQELGIARAVTRERIKRVIEGYTTSKGDKIEGIPNNLTYLQTEEFDKIDIDGRNRKKLVALALNSHKIKYSEDKYETVVVDALFDIEDYVIKDKSKELVFFLDFRDTSSINEITTDIYEKFGKHVLTERFENYYDAERGR